jgi:hypothetical protein
MPTACPASYGLEKILEAYYGYALTASTRFSLDYQLVSNPGCNAECGPVNIFAVRYHWRFQSRPLAQVGRVKRTFDTGLVPTEGKRAPLRAADFACVLAEPRSSSADSCCEPRLPNADETAVAA